MDLERRLADHVVVSDGAMGSELLAREPGLRELDLAVLHCPETILAIHLDYLAAGAEIIQTATFAASRPRLERLGAASETERINEEAVRLAREAREVAGIDCLVAGSIGPLGGILDPADPGERRRLAEALSEQAELLAGRGADLLILESFLDPGELELAVEAVGAVTPLPVAALLTFPSGRPPHPWAEMAAAVARMAASGAAAVGVSCAPGPLGTLRILEHLPRLPRPVVVQPSAGVVIQRPGRELLTPATPRYLAEFARNAVASGAALVGGCCGTGPEHTRAMAEAVRGLRPQPRGAPRPVTIGVGAPPPPAREPRSPLGDALAAGRFVHVVQLDPPRGANSDRVLEAVRAMVRHGGVDAVDINANPLARLRMDSLWLGAEIQRETGMETIPHVTPRDCGVMGIEAHLLGAWRQGIRNLLVITGDPSMGGEYPGHQDVNQVDVFELIRALSRMAEGRGWNGCRIGDPPAFLLGAAVNPNAPDLSVEAGRLRKKVDAGARFVMSQVFFEWAPWERFLEEFGGELPVPALLPVWPLTSYRLALRLHNEVPGIVVPREFLRKLEAAGDGAAELGWERARELLAGAPERGRGAYLIAPFKQPEAILDLVPPRGGSGA